MTMTMEGTSQLGIEVEVNLQEKMLDFFFLFQW